MTQYYNKLVGESNGRKGEEDTSMPGSKL